MVALQFASELVNFTVNDYGLRNNLTLETIDAADNFNVTPIPAFKCVRLYQFTGQTNLVSAIVKSVNNRIDITAIQIVDSTP